MPRALLAVCVVATVLLGCVPENVRHNDRGNAQFSEGAYDEALDEYQVAQVSDPDVAEPYYNAANAHNRKGQVDSASAQTEQALRSADPALASQAWYNLGNAFFDAKQWGQAIQAYRESLRQKPDDADAKHNLELALRELAEQESEQQGESQNKDDGSTGPEDDRSQQEDQPPELQDKEPGDEGEPTPDSQGDDPQDDDGVSPQRPSGAGEETEGMTEERARQILEALVGDAETLQERLRRLRPIEGGRPEQDW